MDIRICLLILVLVIVIIVLIIKIYFLKKSAQEIKNYFLEKTEHETNTLISISSHDKDMRNLATIINRQIHVFNQSRQKYENGDLELKEAITNISHDLRTPLTAIYGYLKLLKNEDSSNVSKEYLVAIENRTKVLKQLTDELFSYTIITSDTEEIILEDVMINGVLEESISTYYAVLKQRNIIPYIDMPEKKIIRQLNENALSRIFSNIISNAVKYSDGDLNIVLTETGEIVFSNHASGLTEIQVGRLFDRFYTVNSARQSTGLGLSIAKALIEKMGGTITASLRESILTICIFIPDK